MNRCYAAFRSYLSILICFLNVGVYRATEDYKQESAQHALAKILKIHNETGMQDIHIYVKFIGEISN